MLTTTLRQFSFVSGTASAAVKKDQPFKPVHSNQVKIPDSVIVPKFWYGSNALPFTDFGIDCLAEYSPSEINSRNTELQARVQKLWKETGLVYLTNTGKTEPNDMRDLISMVIPEEDAMKYEGGSNWRKSIEKNFYDTGAPLSSWIHHHHEMAYVNYSASCLGFSCLVAPGNEEGYTYVSQGVGTTEYLLTTEVGQKLKEKGICYHRHMPDKEFFLKNKKSEMDVYNHWQNSMMTDDIKVAEQRAKEKGLVVEWDLDNPRWGRYMKTRFYVDAYEYCPYTDRNLLFSSIADHSSWFDTWPGLMDIPPEERPLKITYGDDTEFTEEELKVYCDAYDRFGIQVPWKVGEVAIVCNFRWSHGRPIVNLLPGQYRELGVVLGEGFERRGQLPDKW